jgi:hypothetical protein
MKLWHLEYGVYAVGCVVRAETEDEARKLASIYDSAFLDPEQSDCDEILTNGKAEVIVSYDTN